MIFDKVNMQMVLYALEAIKDGNIREEDCGLCYNVCELCIDYYVPNEIISWYSYQWPKHSGVEEYPVPSPFIGKSPEQMYNERELWEGEYGVLRYELLDFLIEVLSKDLEKQTC